MKKKEIGKFFDYILDKIEDCYKKEVEMAIKEFFRETDLEVPVQDQLNTGKYNELLLLLVTISSLVSKALQIIKDDITE
ncbi:hypothetical protein [Clostridium beijerinckii]|uniref:hypothetical protein n=1 Tax=Clostridium beijerinckii TaxID=1520 RepID=UPI00232C8881|nr:hypothetical protein [Clostridium beijerinckii]